jgi:hypothetical protein
MQKPGLQDSGAGLFASALAVFIRGRTPCARKLGLTYIDAIKSAQENYTGNQGFGQRLYGISCIQRARKRDRQEMSEEMAKKQTKKSPLQERA